VVGNEGANSLLMGRPVVGMSVIRHTTPFEAGDLLRVVDLQGRLLAVGEALFPSDQITGMGGNLRVFKPVKVFTSKQA